MEDKLRRLYALQKVDTSLDELEELKGDLPTAIANLEEKIQQVENQLKELENTVKQSLIERDRADLDIATLTEKIEKYKAQQFQVKTNREYDALSREMDNAQESIMKLEKEMETLEGKAQVAKEDMEKLKPQLEDLQKELAEKKRELGEVTKANEDEELRLCHEREKIVVRIDKSDLAIYERIRKAKGGKAVVPVRRNACGGCYNAVPPQKVLELRKNNKIYTCEHCGRILVSDEIVKTSANAL